MTSEYDIVCTSQGLDIHEADARIKELASALIAATCMVRDMAMGWSVDELCQSPEDAMERLDQLVPNHEVEPLT